MANHYANSAIVGSVVGLGIKERSLEDGCWEHDFVVEWVVVGIHSLWCHAPLLAVNGLAIFLKVALGAPQRGGLHVVVEGLAWVDGELAVVFPLVGIAHLHGEGVELDKGVNLGLVAHPVEACDALGEGFAQVANELDHLVLAVASKVLLHVELAHSLAHHAVRNAHAAFPASLALLLSAQRASIEVEACLAHLVAE